MSDLEIKKVDLYTCESHGYIQNNVLQIAFSSIGVKSETYCLLCINEFFIKNFKPAILLQNIESGINKPLSQSTDEGQ